MGKNRKSNTRGRARDRPAASVQARTGVIGASIPFLTASMRATQDLASSETIYAAVLRIANALGTMPVHLYKGTERMDGDPRDFLLSLRPNRRQSAYAFKQVDGDLPQHGGPGLRRQAL